MSERTVTTDVVKDAVTFPRRRLGEPRDMTDDQFDRWLAEVESLAAEKALTDAAHAFAGGAISVEVFSDPAERVAWRRSNETREALVESLRNRAAMYRREEAERCADARNT